MADRFIPSEIDSKRLKILLGQTSLRPRHIITATGVKGDHITRFQRRHPTNKISLDEINFFLKSWTCENIREITEKGVYKLLLKMGERYS